LKIIMTYPMGRDVSTVVRPLDAEESRTFAPAGPRRELAKKLLSTGAAVREGDTWNGLPVSEGDAGFFFRPNTVSFVE
jgi:hypothetical protein